jgi:hypothetical protein
MANVEVHLKQLIAEAIHEIEGEAHATRKLAD